MFGIGSFISPFLAEPFLLQINPINESDSKLPLTTELSTTTELSATNATDNYVSETPLNIGPDSLKIKMHFSLFLLLM